MQIAPKEVETYITFTTSCSESSNKKFTPKLSAIRKIPAASQRRPRWKSIWWRAFIADSDSVALCAAGMELFWCASITSLLVLI